MGKLATEAYGTSTPPYLLEFTSVGMGAPPHRFETYFPPHDRHYEISVAPMGRGYFATIFMDVSERKRHERALQAKTDELDRFFSLAIDLLCIATTDGRFLHVNAAWTTVLGWTVEEIEGRRFLDLVHTDDLSATHQAMAELSAGKLLINFTNRYRARDGSYRFIEWRSAPAPEGRIYAAARDVGERIQHELSLRASEDRLHRIFELIPTPLLLATTDGSVIDCNQAFCAMSGYSRDGIIGHSNLEPGLWTNPGVQERIVEGIEASGESHGVEADLRQKDGKTRTVLTSARQTASFR